MTKAIDTNDAKMNIRQKLIAIQGELKAPKSQVNTFGKYNYRKTEDILEAVKPCSLPPDAHDQCLTPNMIST